MIQKEFSNSKKLSEYVGNLWLELQNKITKKKNFLFTAPASSTPLDLYEWILSNTEKFENWDKAKFVMSDEQLKDEMATRYVSEEDETSYLKFLKEKFFNKLEEKTDFRIDDEYIYPLLDRLNEFDKKISAAGNIDLAIIAVGVRGHYAHVMPGTEENIGYHKTRLMNEFRQVHTNIQSQSYPGVEFRELGMSFGPKQLRAAKKIVVMISGERKRTVLGQLLKLDKFQPNFPISIIYHPEVKKKVELLYTKDAV
jgi:glucosamine-6-phosphate deaminase